MKMTKIICVIFLFVSTLGIAAGKTDSQFSFSDCADVQDFFSGLFVDYAVYSGGELDGLGDMTPFGVPRCQDRMKDISESAVDRYYEMLKAALEKLNSFEADEYDTQTRYNLKTVEWFLRNKIEGEKYRYHESILAPLIGYEGEIYDLFLNQIVIESEKDAEDFISRLSYVPIKTNQAIETFKKSVNMGILMNTSSIKSALNTLYDLTTAPNYSKVYARFKEQTGRLDITPEAKKDLYDRALLGMKIHFVPSMNKLDKTLNDALNIPNGESGVWSYPDGDEYYLYALKTNTTLDLDPQELHEFGKIEVEKIRKRISELVGILGNDTYPNTRESIMDYMDELFYEEFQPEYLPQIIKFYADMYSPPRIDNKTKGVFYSTTGNKKENSLYFHEVVPGHHLERTYNLRMENMPMIRHMCFFTSYIEGWALYSERLAFETLREETLKRELDYLQNLLLRAKRIVADTGINYKRWTRAETVSYMLEDGFSRNLVESDVNRYITWPGQACAYYIGYAKIMELRDMMKARLGDKFDLRDFHKLILENGQMPLELLEMKFKESF